MARRLGDFAIVALGATVTLNAGRISQARIAVTGVGETPQRIPAAEDLLAGARDLDQPLLDAARQAVMGAIEPGSDLHASADYRRHLAGALTQRVVRTAFERAKGLVQ